MPEQPPVPDALAETVRAIADLIWRFHPNRVLAYYLCGSRATGTARAGSDIDLLVVLREGVSQDATEDIQTLLFLCARIAGLPLDLAFLPEDEAREYGTAFLPPEGVFLAGTDIRAEFGSPPPDALTAALMNTAFQIIESAYPPGKMLPYPLPPPDPKDPWLGYVPESQGPQHAVLKPLFKVVMAVVQAMLARQLAVWVRPTHAQIAESYRAVYGEEWVGLIEGMFRPCRSEWEFFIPAGEADRARLRDLCHQALAFVNHFLPFYRQFLLQELRCHNAERRRVARRLITRTPAIRLQNPSPLGHSASP
jgi:predicted nucleotidyltransferase